MCSEWLGLYIILLAWTQPRNRSKTGKAPCLGNTLGRTAHKVLWPDGAMQMGRAPVWTLLKLSCVMEFSDCSSHASVTSVVDGVLNHRCRRRGSQDGRLIFRGPKSGKTAGTQSAKIQALTVPRRVSLLCCSVILSSHTTQIPAWFLGHETRVGLPKN